MHMAPGGCNRRSPALTAPPNCAAGSPSWMGYQDPQPAAAQTSTCAAGQMECEGVSVMLQPCGCMASRACMVRDAEAWCCRVHAARICMACDAPPPPPHTHAHAAVAAAGCVPRQAHQHGRCTRCASCTSASQCHRAEGAARHCHPSQRRLMMGACGAPLCIPGHMSSTCGGPRSSRTGPRIMFTVASLTDSLARGVICSS